MSDNNNENRAPCCCGCARYKKSPRDEDVLRSLRNRLNRISGQLSGISKMLDDGRYCGDILTQVSAVESALQSFGYILLKNHLDTCVSQEVREGNTEIMSETLELIKKLK